MTALRIGTRGSALARVQAEHVAALLRERGAGVQVEIVVIAVSGDEGSVVEGRGDEARVGEGGRAALDKLRWVDRIEDALLDGRIDLAVHSAKDVPGQLADGLELLGAPQREDARDALLGAAGMESLAAGARVGTSSIRRAAQLLAARADLEVVGLAGNVDTRLVRLARGDYDAIVLAAAGLRRLGRLEPAAPLDEWQFVPAPGQGILALEGRAGDISVAHAVAAISDPAAVCALSAERALVLALGADCHTPVGAHARLPGDGVISLAAFAGLPDGSEWVRDRLSGPASEPEALGRQVGERLLAAGAAELLARAGEMSVVERV